MDENKPNTNIDQHFNELHNVMPIVHNPIFIAVSELLNNLLDKCTELNSYFDECENVTTGNTFDNNSYIKSMVDPVNKVRDLSNLNVSDQIKKFSMNMENKRDDYFNSDINGYKITTGSLNASDNENMYCTDLAKDVNSSIECFQNITKHIIDQNKSEQITKNTEINNSTLINEKAEFEFISYSPLNETFQSDSDEEETALDENNKCVSKVNNLLQFNLSINSTLHRPCSSENTVVVENDIDPLLQVKTDYSAKTPAMVTVRLNDIGSNITLKNIESYQTEKKIIESGILTESATVKDDYNVIEDIPAQVTYIHNDVESCVHLKQSHDIGHTTKHKIIENEIQMLADLHRTEFGAADKIIENELVINPCTDKCMGVGVAVKKSPDNGSNQIEDEIITIRSKTRPGLYYESCVSDVTAVLSDIESCQNEDITIEKGFENLPNEHCDTCIESNGVGKNIDYCQSIIKSTDKVGSELEDTLVSENLLFDKHGIIFSHSQTSNPMALLNDIKLKNTITKDQVFKNKTILVYKQEIQSVHDMNTKRALFENNMYDVNKSSLNRSIDYNTSESISAKEEKFIHDDIHVKYSLNVEDVMNLNDEVPLDTSSKYSQSIELCDLDMDNNGNEWKQSKANISSVPLWEKANIPVKNNVILKGIEPTVCYEKMKINVLAMDQGIGLINLENNGKKDCRIKKALYQDGGELFQLEHMPDSQEDLIEDHSYGYEDCISGVKEIKSEDHSVETANDEHFEKENTNDTNFEIETAKYSNLEKETSNDQSFELIEDMCPLELSPELIPCSQVPRETSSCKEENVTSRTPDEIQDYPVFPATQWFQPTVDIKSVVTDGEIYSDESQCFNSHHHNFYSDVNIEEDAVVPIPRCKRSISQIDLTMDENQAEGKLKLEHFMTILPTSPCFPWNLTKNTASHDEKPKIIQPAEEFVCVKPMVTCCRPLRIGLSKKQKTQHLHPLHK